jgi:serine/threonine protein kinase
MINRCIEKQIFFNKYKLQKLINKSAFSYVYKGINIINKELVAIKIENKITMINILESETYILFNLKGFGIPNVISFGKSGKYNILVEELLGPSLGEILKLKRIKNGFPIKEICMIALQGLDRLEYIHSKNIIHRDIKPHNFLIGRKDEKIIYLIDFGLARKYKSSRTGKFIKFTNLGILFGSMAFSSINANAGYEQSRRDDLESLGYMLINLAKKDLPWMKIDKKKSKKEKVFLACRLKKRIKIEKLCEGLPEEFIDYLKYCRKLEFEQEPNYNYLRNLFILILIKENQKNDLNFFWINKKNAKSATKNYENNFIIKEIFIKDFIIQ